MTSNQEPHDETGQHDRGLNWLEKEMTDLNMTAVGLFVCNLHEVVERSRLAAAWKLCCERHPNLRSKVVNDRVVHANTTSIPVFIDNGDVDELFTKYSNDIVPGYREPAPSDLVIIINNNKLNILIRMLHALTDGTSLSIILNDVLNFYDALGSGPIDVESLPFLIDPLSIEDPAGALKDSAEYTQQTAQFIQKKNDFNVYMPYDKSKYYPTKGTPCGIIRSRGTPHGLKNLLQVCRESNLTIGAVLMATMTFALGKIRKSTNLDKFTFDLEVNLRNRFSKKMGTEGVGCLIGSFPITPAPAADETLWTVAKKLRRESLEQIERKLEFIYMHIYAEYPWENETFMKYIADNQGFSDTLVFSNIGRYPFERKYKLCTVTEQYTAGARWIPSFSAYAILFSSLEEMCFTIMYPDLSDINRQYAQQLLDDVIHVTENISAIKDLTLTEYIET